MSNWVNPLLPFLVVEAQRIKLASFLVKGTIKDNALFVFDEPTTGLHFHDIKKLLKSFDALIEKGQFDYCN